MLLRAIRLQVVAIVSKRTLVLSDRNSAQLRLIRKGVKISASLSKCNKITPSTCACSFITMGHRFTPTRCSSLYETDDVSIVPT